MTEGKNVLLTWKIPEHVRHQRGRGWYIFAGLVGAILIIYGIFTNNFLFALIVVLFAIISVLLHMQEPAMINFSITGEGVFVGGRGTDYKDLQNFWVVEGADGNAKSLHLRTKSFFYPLISVPLEDSIGEETVRVILKKYIKEDVEEKDEPLSETLSRRLKF